MNYQRKILNHTLAVFITVNLILVVLLFLRPIVGKNMVITLGAAVFILSTLIVSKLENLDTSVLGIRSDSFKKDISYALVAVIIIFPLFLIANHIYQIFFLHHKFQFVFREGILRNAVNNLLVAALPEEIFFRGYIQGQMSRVYNSRIFYNRVSTSNLITSLLFALGHFFTNPRFDRLAVFFPSLLFGYFREKRGNIYTSVVFHWISNVVMYIALGMYK